MLRWMRSMLMGSGVFAEKFTLEETLAKTDAQGVTVGEALTAIGYAGSRKCQTWQGKGCR